VPRLLKWGFDWPGKRGEVKATSKAWGYKLKNINGIILYENLKEIVDPKHSCLVVWDVQNGLVDRIFNKEEFLSSLKPLIETLRGKMPVFYTLVTPLPRYFASSWFLYSMMRRFNVDDINKLPAFMSPGSPESGIPRTIEPKEGDIVLKKSFASIFLGTNFEFMLRNRAITTILFAGIATEMGIESSARDASNRGFYPVVVSDCISSMDREAHERSLKNMEKLFIVEKSGTLLKLFENS
jgi:nicotinamidase-related amidase